MNEGWKYSQPLLVHHSLDSYCSLLRIKLAYSLKPITKIHVTWPCSPVLLKYWFRCNMRQWGNEPMTYGNIQNTLCTAQTQIIISCTNSPFRYISVRSSTAPRCSFTWADVTCFSAVVTSMTSSLKNTEYLTLLQTKTTVESFEKL